MAWSRWGLTGDPGREPEPRPRRAREGARAQGHRGPGRSRSTTTPAGESSGRCGITASTPNPTAASHVRCEDHHRDRPGRLPLIIGEGRVLLGDHRPQTRALIRPSRHGRDGELFLPILDRCPRVRQKVPVPVRVRRRSTLRRDDDVSIAVAKGRERIRAPDSRLGSGVREEQERLGRAKALTLPSFARNSSMTPRFQSDIRPTSASSVSNDLAT
jgi:hypothetical protein